ncbi:MAG: cadmium-translocating P-type ATPase [Deltaproteobacteria bacterium]|nr:cadmium-translocating P-type ATPase [Deltaproteobacteria bacterium]
MESGREKTAANCSCGDICTLASRRVFRVEGMDCAYESAPILSALSALPGVGRAVPSYSDSTLTVEFDPHAVTPERMAQAISGAGFKVRIDERESEALTYWERYGRVTATSVSGGMLAAGLILRFLDIQPLVAQSFLLLATIAGGWYVSRRAWQALRHHQLEMNTLMTTAAVGALLIGEWAEAGSAMFLFSLAQLLEARSMDRARNAIRRLLDLSPKEATVLRGGEEIRLPVDQIVVGDTVLLRPGERVPVDGLVVEGASSVNQAPITGESIPVAKAPGSRVLAGSLNGRGVLNIRVERPASDSSLARIIHLVENAQAQRARSQAFIDRFARYYTPAMIAFALALVIVPPLLFGQPFSAWLYRGLVVLVIACPCALVISTPVSIVCGLTRAAREGILFKGGVYLEELGRIRTFFFDKTGTLTRGKPEVVHVRSFCDLPEDQLLRLAASLESRSEHPLAAAILEAAGRNESTDSLPAPTFVQAVPGMGIRGKVNGGIYLLGNPAFFDNGAGLATAQRAAVGEWERKGATVVLIGVEKMPLGMIAIRDSVREEANAGLAGLRLLGANELTMLTGDNPETGKAIASQLPIDTVHAGLLPESKVALVREAVAKGKKVAMVGDGINDAPALASATVGVVMGAAGTDVALEAGDVALMGDDLRKLPFAVRLGRRTLRIIRFNVAFSLGTKAVFLVLATLGMVTLWMGVAADMGASLLVIGNSLRLLWGSNGSRSLTHIAKEEGSPA